MKKVLCTTLALSMALTSLAGCGGGTSETESTTETGDIAGTTLKVAALESAYGSEMWLLKSRPA